MFCLNPKIVFLLATTCILAGCSVGNQNFNGLEKSASAAKSQLVADLTAAEKDAQAQSPPDTIAATCYGTEIKFIEKLDIPDSTNSFVGPVQTFQVTRDIQNAIASNDPHSLKVTCAPLWLDEKQKILQFVSLLGIANLALP